VYQKVEGRDAPLWASKSLKRVRGCGSDMQWL
jgi:hypothetical protein